LAEISPETAVFRGSSSAAARVSFSPAVSAVSAVAEKWSRQAADAEHAGENGGKSFLLAGFHKNNPFCGRR